MQLDRARKKTPLATSGPSAVDGRALPSYSVTPASRHWQLATGSAACCAVVPYFSRFRRAQTTQLLFTEPLFLSARSSQLLGRAAAFPPLAPHRARGPCLIPQLLLVAACCLLLGLVAWG
jgi:hypothetical protein